MESPIHHIKALRKTGLELKKLGNIPEGDPSHGEVARLRLEKRSAILALLAYAAALSVGGGAVFAIGRNQNRITAAFARQGVSTDRLTELFRLDLVKAIISRINDAIASSTLNPEGTSLAIKLVNFLQDNASVHGKPLRGTENGIGRFEVITSLDAPNVWSRTRNMSASFHNGALCLAYPATLSPSHQYSKSEDPNGIAERAQHNIRIADWLIAINDTYNDRTNDHASEYATDVLADPKLSSLIPKELMDEFLSQEHVFKSVLDSGDGASTGLVIALVEFGRQVALSVLSKDSDYSTINGFAEASAYLYTRHLLSSNKMHAMNQSLADVAANPMKLHLAIGGE